MPEGCEQLSVGFPAQLPDESGTGRAFGMAWSWRNWVKSRKTAHGKEKHMELEEGARWEAGVQQ